MGNMDGWDIALLGAAAYVAVMSLVRLMRSRHDRLIADLQRQAEQERRRKKKAERAAKKQQAEQQVRRAA